MKLFYQTINLFFPNLSLEVSHVRIVRKNDKIEGRFEKTVYHRIIRLDYTEKIFPD